MWNRIARALRPMDTTEFDEALAEARNAHKAVQVRARALRMDVGCGDPVEAIRRLTTPVPGRGNMWSRLFHVDHDTPEDLRGLLGKL